MPCATAVVETLSFNTHVSENTGMHVFLFVCSTNSRDGTLHPPGLKFINLDNHTCTRHLPVGTWWQFAVWFQSRPAGLGTAFPTSKPSISGSNAVEIKASPRRFLALLYSNFLSGVTCFMV
jgi:hypothetical protein